jgi:flavin reductase (DIM6/NTAB) family NADH-FMN oxidoreductase RutF
MDSLIMTARSQRGLGDVPDAAPAEFKRALGQWASGVAVITAIDSSGDPFGVTATSFGALSLDPPLIQWSLRTAAWSHRVFAAAGGFAVNILAADQADVSTRFATPDIDRFALTPFESGLDSLPLLGGCAAWLECKLETMIPGGDHTLFIGRVRRTAVAERSPLLHWHGAYGRFDRQSGS